MILKKGLFQQYHNVFISRVFPPGDRNDAKYALKYTHKNEEVGGLTTGYSLLVTRPVFSCNHQDL